MRIALALLAVGALALPAQADGLTCRFKSASGHTVYFDDPDYATVDGVKCRTSDETDGLVIICADGDRRLAAQPYNEDSLVYRGATYLAVNNSCRVGGPE